MSHPGCGRVKRAVAADRVQNQTACRMQVDKNIWGETERGREREREREGGLGHEPHVRPADSLRAEGYPDDPAIVDNPYQIGLFLGAPQLRRTGPTLFPPPAPGPPSVTLRVPASSSSSAGLFHPGGDWQGIIAHLAEEPGARAGDDRQDGGDESSRARPGGASGRNYPSAPQVVHREGPREGAGYAYRGTIVGEASHPGPADPGAVLRGRLATAGRCWGLADLGECRASLSGWGGSPLASPMGESGRPYREAPSANGDGSLPPSCEGGLSPPGDIITEAVYFGSRQASPKTHGFINLISHLMVFIIIELL